MAKCMDCFKCRTQLIVQPGINSVGLLKKFWCRAKRFTPLEYTTRNIGTPHAFTVEHRCPDFDGDESITE